MPRHKHADLIHAWAEGAEIQYRSNSQFPWMNTDRPTFAHDGEYRIKPTPKLDILMPLKISSYGDFQWHPKEAANVMITFDGETGQLKSAEVLK